MSAPVSLHKGRFVELVKLGRWEYVRRVNARGAVFVLAVTDASELLLVEQFRVPLDARTLELPAGIIGDEESSAEETAEACAVRELEEETGYRAARTRLLLQGPVAPGLTDERLFLVRAEGLTRVHDGGGVGGEDIVVPRVPLASADAWLSARMAAGLQVDARVYAGLHFLDRERRP